MGEISNSYLFAERVKAVPNSLIGFMMRYGARYPDVLSLGQGTPLFPTPDFIYEYVISRAKKDPGVGMYANPKIEAELKELIAQEMEKSDGFCPAAENLCLTVGGIGGLYAALMSLVQAGDEVIYFDPSYPLHLSQIHLTGARPVFVSLKESEKWAIDLELLEKSITPKTKVILLTNPNNPTGTILTESEMHELTRLVINNQLILVLDEAYRFLSYDGSIFSPIKLPELRDRLVVCRSFSKEYAMTGWRIGFVYAPEQIVEKINEIQPYFCISPPTPSIIAVIGALSDPRGLEARTGFIRELMKSRETICRRLDRLPKLFSYVKPAGAYYVFPRILGLELASLEVAKLLVDEARVVTIPGSSMGPSGEGHLRLSFAAPPDYIDRAFDRLELFARNYKLL
mgnify:CR=1 FL=1